MRLSVRDLVYIGLFGGLWGVLEAGLGSVLHALGLLPVTGLILGSAGLAVALAGRVMVPRPGAVLAIGLVAAFLKMLSFGGLVLNPMIAITAESAIAEVVVDLGRPSRLTFMLAGALGCTWSVLFSFIVIGLIGGRGLVAAWAEIVGKGAKLLGLSASAALAILAVLVSLHLAFGAVGGMLGWDVGQTVRQRLRSDGGADPAHSA